MIVYIVLDMFNKVRAVFDSQEKADVYVNNHNNALIHEGCYIVKKKVI